jgi:cytochrome c oxidase subunit 4
MTEPHHSEEHAHDPTPYFVVFGALCGFTLISFLVNWRFGLGSVPGMSIIVAVAVIKATLVGTYFMHLKQDWGKVFFMIIPCFILATMLIIVLLPDIVLAWHQ